MLLVKRHILSLFPDTPVALHYKYAGQPVHQEYSFLPVCIYIPFRRAPSASLQVHRLYIELSFLFSLIVEPGLGYLCLYLQFHISFHYLRLANPKLCSFYSSFIYIRECQRNRYTGSSRTGRRKKAVPVSFIRNRYSDIGSAFRSRQFIFPGSNFSTF